jgi:Rap1a immunity proteins
MRTRTLDDLAFVLGAGGILGALAILFFAAGSEFRHPVRVDTAGTAGEWASHCEPFRTATDAADKLRADSTLNSHCWGAFANLEEVGVEHGPGPRTVYRFCIPRGTDRLKLVKAFIKYMDVHPNREHEEFGPVLFDSMAHAYPCVMNGERMVNSVSRTVAGSQPAAF